MATLALVMRGTNVLARPSGSNGGPVPSVEEVSQFMTVIEFYDHDRVRVVKSSTGEPPQEWRWVPIMDLQDESDVGDLLGEAVLCGG